MPDNTSTVTIRRVTPAAFAAWLQAQGQVPSTHVLAWFKSKGVAWPPVTALGSDAAPAAGPAVLRAEDVRDFAGLVQYRKQFLHLPKQQRPPWAPHVEILRTEVNRPGSGGKAGAARLLELSATRLGELLNLPQESVAKEAGPWAGLSGSKRAA